MTLRNIDALFSSRSVTVFGTPSTPAQHQLLDNIQASAGDACRHITGRASRRQFPDAPDTVGVILDARWARPRAISALAEAGCRALVWAANSPITDDVLRAARPTNLRVLGGRSAGVMDTRGALNMTSLALTPRAGKVALITQSQSLTAGALDWALGRNIGFSWLACTGAEADIDAADLLDHAALDPRTRAVVLQVGEIKQPRKFMSAARAAARVKPVLVLQTQPRDARTTGPDPIRSAAFARAGLIECENLGGLFDGLAALELLPAVQTDRVMVLGNGAGVCALASDALRRQSLMAARPGDEMASALSDIAPRAHDTPAGIDLAGSSTEETVATLRAALANTKTDGVLLVHSPVAGHPHGPMVEAIAQAGLDSRLMTVWLGLATALPARSQAADARLATFASVDEAARAVRYRQRYYATRELLTTTPPPDPSVTADIENLRHRLDVLAADGVEWLAADDTAELLAEYGILGAASGRPSADPSMQVRIEVVAHDELGMVMRVTDETLGVSPAYGFAPLDTLLARRMLEGASAGRLSATTEAVEALAQALVRLSKLVVDLARIARLDLHLAIGPHGRLHTPTETLVEITATPMPERRRLAMSPYPARMRHRVTLGDRNTYVVRAIRPSDEPLVLELLDSLSPEEIRLRFFTYIRHFSHDMAARITQVDYDREVSLVISSASDDHTLAAMGTIIADPDGREAEFAVLVQHSHTGAGLGRHLLDCLLRQAWARDIGTVYGDILAHNRPMLELAKGLGFSIKRSLDDPSSVRADIDVGAYRAAQEARAAARANKPKS
ncbi:GNAT family N-acetyltransferase [uncultured Salinisphaera sp.]|uniref:bifunctional acetate--CoA ligase family protein/GNAT family N-acetyltransferase n=1 Tax=uncultured Salinisphaera sp. TaxID=359372 RepID=UPI0032B18AA8|tara:strand:+ start:5607 stop:7985 length:2379 start_codon:yes stop_codon:yes gene_type:complete